MQGILKLLSLFLLIFENVDLALSSHNQHLYPPVDISPLSPPPHVNMPNIPAGEIQAMLEVARAAIEDREQIFEPTILKKGVTLTPNTPSWFMARSRTIYDTARNLSSVALLAEEVTNYISKKYQLRKEQICYGMPHVDMKYSDLGKLCPMQVDYPCQPKKYRAYSGYCNNVQNPKWGNSNTRLLRYIASDYADGISVPRGGGLESTELPSSREVSLTVHGDSDVPHKHLMVLTAAWGEFIAHDLTHVPQVSGYQGSPLKCCGVNYADFHSECYPIKLPDNDPVYAPRGQRCQDYVRSSTAPRTGCTFGPREQLNQVTSFLDASAIYGTTKEQSDELREFSRGRLKTQNTAKSKSLLPQDDDPYNCRQHRGLKCFKSGDVRVNENVALTVIHTLWMREHNRVAEQLHRINPSWGDETLFQEARRVVAAEIQHITYSEFLPVVLGQDNVEKFGLTLQPFEHYTGYDINMNAGVANSVAAAALKFVSSLIPKSLKIIDESGRVIVEQDLAKTFYAPFMLYDSGGVDRVLRGLLHGQAQSEDSHINDVMTNHMFQEDKSPATGLDLAAQIIQQGRDHGLPAYYKWREFCNLTRVGSFRDLEGFMSGDIISALQSAYRNVTDIDLFTGAISEIPEPGSVVGPTLSCLLARQFHYLRRGDRYWYENDLPPSSFSKDQLNEIRKATLARVICDNTDIKIVQPKVFLGNDAFLNAMIPCQANVIKNVNLGVWKVDQRNFFLPNQILHDAIDRAKRDIQEIFEKEINIYKQKSSADPLSPVGTAFGFNRPKRQAAEIANTSVFLEHVSSRFVNSFLQSQIQDEENGINDIEAKDLQELLAELPNVDVTDILEVPRVMSSCDEHTLPCDHTAKYRSITGWCNNLQTPGQGKSLRAFSRLLPPKYSDGVGSPRSSSVTGQPLPSARLISTSMHPDTSRPHVRYSLMFMQLGQLVDHDLTHTPVNKAFVGDAILDCRPCDAATSVHPECFPIPVPSGDPYFPKFNITTGTPLCIPVTRSMPGQLTLGYREQLNQITAYLDSSFVYGSDVCESKILRSFIRGKLNTTQIPSRKNKDLLPQINTHPECKSSSKICFRGGDARASEQPALAAIHTVFLREHNRMADSLSRLNPQWNDETIYQQARRILSAATQHMTFTELLPRVFGWEGVHKYGLELEPEGYYSGYDPNCDATIVNEFAAAAFRFGHSLLKPSLLRVKADYTLKEPNVRLRDTFFNPDVLYETNVVDQLLRGLTATPMETLDQFITNEVTNHLFEDRRMPYSGMDLAAINIQRGRDHGIQSYNEYRAFCNISRAKDFDDLKREISPPAVEALRKIYNHVDDIDLFPGGLSETPLVGGVIGPTFACIIGHQFRRLRSCDRFWYETDNSLIRFTEAQLMEIRKITLARIICDNTDTITHFQRQVLDLEDPFLNPRVPCSSLPSINIELWKERQTCTVGETNIEVNTAKRISPCVTCTCTKEGPICQSLKILNCIELSKSFNREAVLSDHVCKVQCAYVFRALPNMRRLRSRELGFT